MLYHQIFICKFFGIKQVKSLLPRQCLRCLQMQPKFGFLSATAQKRCGISLKRLRLRSMARVYFHDTLFLCRKHKIIPCACICTAAFTCAPASSPAAKLHEQILYLNAKNNFLMSVNWLDAWCTVYTVTHWIELIIHSIWSWSFDVCVPASFLFSTGNAQRTFAMPYYGKGASPLAS